jgi:arylsulfatase A-like enzyme
VLIVIFVTLWLSLGESFDHRYADQGAQVFGSFVASNWRYVTIGQETRQAVGFYTETLKTGRLYAGDSQHVRVGVGMMNDSDGITLRMKLEWVVEKDRAIVVGIIAVPCKRAWYDFSISIPQGAGVLRFTKLPQPQLPPANWGKSVVVCVPVLVSKFSSRSNLILISLDTLRADHLGCYGYRRDTSPNMDKLAREGILFENAFAQSPWTLPSHMSLFTGLYPLRHRVRSDGDRLSPQIPMLAQLLQQQNYQTVAFTDGAYMTPDFGFHKGFLKFQVNHSIQDFAGQVSQTIDWLKENKDCSFFLFLHTYAIHNPYNPPSPYKSRFDPTYTGKVNGTTAQLNDIDMGKIRIDSRDLYHIKALYDGSIQYVDDNLGRFLRFLEDEKLSESTMVVVFSDHGETLRDHHDYLLHGRYLYDELIRIPLIIRLPKQKARGLRVSTICQLVDVTPTVLEFLGIKKVSRFDGVSVVPLVSGNNSNYFRRRVAFAEEPRWESIAVRSESDKLIQTACTKSQDLGVAPYEYYDLRRDPGERKTADAKHQLAAHRDEIVRYMLNGSRGSLVFFFPHSMDRLRVLLNSDRKPSSLFSYNIAIKGNGQEGSTMSFEVPAEGDYSLASLHYEDRVKIQVTVRQGNGARPVVVCRLRDLVPLHDAIEYPLTRFEADRDFNLGELMLLKSLKVLIRPPLSDGSSVWGKSSSGPSITSGPFTQFARETEERLKALGYVGLVPPAGRVSRGEASEYLQQLKSVILFDTGFEHKVR